MSYNEPGCPALRFNVHLEMSYGVTGYVSNENNTFIREKKHVAYFSINLFWGSFQTFCIKLVIVTKLKKKCRVCEYAL